MQTTRIRDLLIRTWRNPADRLLFIAMALLAIGGLISGLVYAWYVDPVEWTNITPAHLEAPYRDIYVRNAADVYSYDGDIKRLEAAMAGWGGPAAACEMATASSDPAEQMRLIAAAYIVNGTACNVTGPQP